MTPFRLATAQLPISGDARVNGRNVQAAMRDAAARGTRLIHFPEGMLSGYAKNPIQDWAKVDWDVVREELEAVMALAAALKLWVVLGSAHPLTPPHWPHNSMYVISDQGSIVTRYDKRVCSYTEVTRFYIPGHAPTVFEVDGWRFGCVICVEINFPALFMDYDRLGVDAVLLSTYPVDRIFLVKARAHAAIHNVWISVSSVTETDHLFRSALIDPRGEVAAEVPGVQGVVVSTLDRSAPELDIALAKARPWRASVADDPRYDTAGLDDPRSTDRTSV
ncbi:carbon-nitrogen hydrolase family protein [uncultured Deinococcus sp.]|uniref:carbon-nitrogen hydrolase family protein n=1 Tax=uncultured Deinococcus sp. TaxID=158789 RepID=UPI0025DFD8A3|nr:carbon-nitrogen hydrolase family protein [uncultured Deinococcus sp.]